MKVAFRLLAVLVVVLSLSAAAAVFAQEDIEFPEASDTIAVGDEISGELNEDNPIVAYAFEGSAGDIVYIDVAFDDVDGYLLLADAEGTQLAENDDSRSLFASTIPAFELPEDGTYLIGVTTYDFVRAQDGSEESDFTLSLMAPEVTSLAFGDEVEGELTEETPNALYFVEAETGQLLVVSVESEDFDTQLSLDPAAGQDMRALTNDDFGDGTNSQIGPTLISEGGRYVITISSFFEDEFGSYTLSVSESEPTPLATDETARGELTLDASDQFFSFEAEEGQDITIAVEAVETIDLVLDVYDPNGQLAAYNDDAEDLNPVAEFTAPEDGTYTVRVYPAAIFLDETSLGEFDITLTVTE